jgi:hydroxymethylglutaryl-CoA lyase
MKRTVVKSESAVTVVDCGPRDGLGALEQSVSTGQKVRLINSLIAAGIKKIDCVAFTHPLIMPKSADAEQVVGLIEKRPDVKLIGLAPSEVACRRSALTEIDEILALVAATEQFNKAALGLSLRQLMNKSLPAIFETARQGGKAIRAYILTAFGCPYSGPVDPDTVLEVASRLAQMGVAEISLVDSTGTANPKQVKHLVRSILALELDSSLAVHFHDIRGTAIANCVAAYEAGVRIFDTAIGGLSGTPFGAPHQEIGIWNVPTEDLINLFEEMGVNTGVDMERLLESVRLAEEIAGRRLPGHIGRSGPNARLAEIPKRLSLK